MMISVKSDMITISSQVIAYIIIILILCMANAPQLCGSSNKNCLAVMWQLIDVMRPMYLIDINGYEKIIFMEGIRCHNIAMYDAIQV